MKKFFLIFLLLFLFACHNNSQNISENLENSKNNSEILENQGVQTKSATFAENLTFEWNELPNSINHSYKKIFLSSNVIPVLVYREDNLWYYVNSIKNLPTDTQKADIFYVVNAFDDISEMRAFFEINPHLLSFGILRLSGDFSREEILEIFQILDEKSKEADFIVIDGLDKKYLQDTEIAEKFQKYQESFAKIFPNNIAVNLEMSSVFHFDREDEVNYIDTKEKNL